jgi:hypothetical protein
MDSTDPLVRAAQEWERLELAAGVDPDALRYPPDIAAALEAELDADAALAALVADLTERLARGECLEIGTDADGNVMFHSVPRPPDAGPWEAA